MKFRCFFFFCLKKNQFSELAHSVRSLLKTCWASPNQFSPGSHLQHLGTLTLKDHTTCRPKKWVQLLNAVESNNVQHLERVNRSGSWRPAHMVKPYPLRELHPGQLKGVRSTPRGRALMSTASPTPMTGKKKKKKLQ